MASIFIRLTTWHRVPSHSFRQGTTMGKTTSHPASERSLSFSAYSRRRSCWIRDGDNLLN